MHEAALTQVNTHVGGPSTLLVEENQVAWGERLRPDRLACLKKGLGLPRYGSTGAQKAVVNEPAAVESVRSGASRPVRPTHHGQGMADNPHGMVGGRFGFRRNFSGPLDHRRNGAVGFLGLARRSGRRGVCLFRRKGGDGGHHRRPGQGRTGTATQAVGHDSDRDEAQERVHHGCRLARSMPVEMSALRRESGGGRTLYGTSWTLEGSCRRRRVSFGLAPVLHGVSSIVVGPPVPHRNVCPASGGGCVGFSVWASAASPCRHGQLTDATGVCYEREGKPHPRRPRMEGGSRAAACRVRYRCNRKRTARKAQSEREGQKVPGIRTFPSPGASKKRLN